MRFKEFRFLRADSRGYKLAHVPLQKLDIDWLGELYVSPRAYWLTKSIKRPNKGKQQPPTNWNSSTITKILSLQEYCRDILNFKTYSKSYKNKKRIGNDRENWVVFQDIHEPIIERAVYEQYEDEQKELSGKKSSAPR